MKLVDTRSFLPRKGGMDGLVALHGNFPPAVTRLRQSYLHQYLLSSITTLDAGELRHLTGMNMLYFTSHTFVLLVGGLAI